MADVSEQAIRELVAKQAIRDALYRYCRGEDRLDLELSRSLWHPDGTASYGHNGALFDGPVSEWSTHASISEYSGSSHQVGNILIDLAGDHAGSEAYVTARLWKVSDDGTVWQRVTVGRYLDRWSCRDGIWAVDHRRFIFELSYASTIAPPAGEKNKVWENNPEWFEGRQGPDDPSYDVVGGLTPSAAN